MILSSSTMPRKAVIAAAYQGDVKTATGPPWRGSRCECARTATATRRLRLRRRARPRSIWSKLLLKKRSRWSTPRTSNGETALLRAAGGARPNSGRSKFCWPIALTATAGDRVKCAASDAGRVFRFTSVVVKELLAYGVDATARNAFGQHGPPTSSRRAMVTARS